MPRPKAISVVRIGNIRFSTEGKYSPSALEYIIRDELANKLSKADKRSLDVLHELIQNDPKTGQVTAGSVQAIVRPANLFLGSQLYKIGATMKRRQSFPKATTRGGENAKSDKRISLATDTGATPTGEYLYGPPVTPGSVIGKGWKNLSYSWLRQIGFTVKKTKAGYRVHRSGRTYIHGGQLKHTATQGPKTFWRERGRQGSQIKGTRGAAVYAAAQFMAMRLVAMQATGGDPFSKIGKVDAFTVTGMKRRRARSYKATSRAGRKYVVWSVTGDLLYPSRIRIGNALSDEFTRMIVGSMESGTPQSGTSSVSSLLAGKTGDASQDWASLIIANEHYRPWIGPWFSQMEKYLIQYLQENLREDFGRSPPF